MIQPTLQVTATQYIHAARAAIWERFCRLADWPRWRTDVAQATWVQGTTWAEEAQFRLTPTPQGSTPSQYMIRMVVVDDTTVWERVGAGPTVVYSLHLDDQVGGTKVTLRSNFYGWHSLLQRVRYQSEAASLRAILDDLKREVEGNRPR
ncbi:MAG: SRPBCC family protein [Caldilineaceae bacterium]|nr:SRPBCC family protein [Caldilineaceae bacterium]